jgi:hypothetical protein
MPDFAIVDPKLGLNESMPTVSLQEAFMAKGSENIHQRYGRYDRMRGRLPEFIDSAVTASAGYGTPRTANVAIKAPTDVFPIVSVTGATKTIVVTGNVLTGTTPIADGDTIRVNGGTEAANNMTFTVNGTPVWGGVNSTIIVDEEMTDNGLVEGNVFVGATPIIRYHRHLKRSNNDEHIIIATKYHLFLWQQISKSMLLKFTVGDQGGSPEACTRWDIVDHLRDVVATNNTDLPLWWNVDTSAGKDFVPMGSLANGFDIADGTSWLTKCKYLYSFERYLFLGHTTEDGEVYPQRVRWSSIGTGSYNAGGATDFSDIDFDENGAGDAGAKEFSTTPGRVMGFARHGDDLVVSKIDSMHRAWLVTSDTVFEWQEYTLKVGNLSADSLINDKAGRLYWLGSDLTIREISTPKPISTAVDVTIKQLNSAQAEFVQGGFIDEFDEIWWAFTSGGSETNDKVVAFHQDSGRAFIHTFPIRAFGDFTQQEQYTWDTLPFDSWTAWGADWLIWDTQRNVVGFPLDLGSDYLGNSFNLHRADTDNGQTITGKLIFSTTLTNPKSFNIFKRVNNGCDVWMNRKSTGTIYLYCKRDTEKGWQLLGTASMEGTDVEETVIVHIPFDMRAKSFQFKIETTGPMEFVGMVFRDFYVDDDR